MDHHAKPGENPMKLNDEAVLEPLHLQPADLSSGRRFHKEASGEAPGQQTLSPTRPVLETRGILWGIPRSGRGQNEVTQSVLEARGVLGRPRAPSAVSVEGQGGGQVSTDLFWLNLGPAEPPVRPWVVWVPVVPMSRDGFEVLQKFAGCVLAVKSDSFVARLLDKTNSGPEEEAEIPLAEVMPGDRGLVKPGATFYWVIGYRREAHGQVSRSSVIRFQRVPSWSAEEVEQAKQAAATLLSFLDLDRANKPA